VKVASPKRQFIVNLAWVPLSVIWIGITVGKIEHLRADGRYVDGWRYIQAGFWVVLLLFWIWSAWSSWKRYGTEREG